MNPISASEVKAELQQILNDTTVWTDAKLIININAAIRQLFGDRPAARFTSPVAFSDSAVVTAVGSGDTIPVDIHWRPAIVHYAAHLCFNQSDRNTANAAFAAEQLRLYGSSI